MFGFPQLEQGDADQREPRQVERFDGYFRGQGFQSVLAFLARDVIQFRDIYFDFEFGMDELQGLFVLHGERGSQCLMPFDDFIEAVFQSRQFQLATKTKSVRQVISRITRRHLIDQPHLALSKRQGGGVTIGPSGYFRTPGQTVGSPLPAPLQQRLLHR